ncbi:serine hydrolase domain-containing protein [Parvularcula sp. IMCC14364]|uniref:serine hydrolase domain-containing protein n=1 Tax=Parvularcula sp. IMCC14364 TaxID=3067902 RepID=UPI00274099B2|nr:serine hydrolase domain-containing protein [Parvularcula sp. IMCC14364]
MTIQGAHDPRFEAVRTAFAANLDSGDDLGAACAVCLGGELVVDLFGGYQDRKKEVPWARETIVGIYSSGKAVISLLIARAVNDGLLSYDAPVADYWPDFAVAGKGEITLAQLMSHQAGLSGFPDEMDPATWLDWGAICEKLAAMPPMWQPGNAHGYHPQTFGYLAGEVLRRVTGRTVGELITLHLAEPFDLDIYCGLDEGQMARASHMSKPTKLADMGEINEPTKAAFLTKWAAPAGVSREDWSRAEIPASNIHADARGLARAMSIIATDGRIDGQEFAASSVIDLLSREQIRGQDLVLPYEISWACGLMRNSNKVYGPVEATLGHSGFGGSCVFADRENGLSFAYVMNKMSHHLMGDPRPARLIDAVYKSL